MPSPTNRLDVSNTLNDRRLDLDYLCLSHLGPKDEGGGQ